MGISFYHRFLPLLILNFMILIKSTCHDRSYHLLRPLLNRLHLYSASTIKVGLIIKEDLLLPDLLVEFVYCIGFIKTSNLAFLIEVGKWYSRMKLYCKKKRRLLNPYNTNICQKYKNMPFWTEAWTSKPSDYLIYHQHEMDELYSEEEIAWVL